MAVSTGRSKVLHGFEAGMRAAIDLLQRPGSVVILISPKLLEEFGSVAIEHARVKATRRESIRIVVAGKVRSEVSDEAASAGIEIRSVEGRRELGFIAGEDGAIIFPTDQSPQGMINELSILVEDVLAVALLRLGFERTWEEAAPHP